MKGLLHSKKFRRNLYKWLFMYVGCIALLTTVVTYSKYMSTFQSSDTARVAKFNVEVENRDCTDEITDNCNLDWYRSTSNIDYYFTVDTRDIEVKTQLYFTLYINKNFSLVDNTLVEVDGENYSLSDPVSVAGNDQYNFITLKDDNLNIVNPEDGSLKIYKITLKYNGTDYTNFNGTSKDIFRVAYSAVQMTN